MSSSPPTVRSLAAKAGVSAATVALALKDSPRISAATRARIQALAREEGYRPDPTVRKLMQYLREHRGRRQRANIAIVTPPPDAPRYFTPQLIEGITERAQEMGYAVSIVNYSNREPDCLSFARILRARGIQGLVFAPMSRTEPLHPGVDLSEFSVVAASASILSPRFHNVIPNHYANVLRACQHLSEMGYRRIGVALTTNKDIRDGHQCVGALAWHMIFKELTVVQPLILDAPDPKRILAWLAGERPQVVIAEHYFEHYLTQLPQSEFPWGHRPPVTGLYWPSPNPESVGGIDIREREIGRITIDVLSGLIERGEMGVPEIPRTTVIDGRWCCDRKRLKPPVVTSAGKKLRVSAAPSAV